jgi:multidrug efflux system membrane fusion protein
LVFFGGCSEAPEQEVVAAPVRTVVLQTEISDPFRRFPGAVSAVQTSEMSFDVSGRLIERPATQGAVMAAGELLARLDPENFEAAVSSARARFNNARDQLARQTQLRDRGVISAAELDRFQTEFEVAEAALRQTERALADTRLVAPFDGRVARTIINNFQSVRANEPVLIFQNVSELEVDIDVPERLMTLGEQGMTAEQARNLLEAKVEFPALAGRHFPLVLKSFRTAAETTARTFRVTFSLIPPEGTNILPGMTGTVLLRRTGQAATVEESLFEVPVTALGTWETETVVWRLDEESMTAQPVVVELEGPVGDAMRVRAEDLQPGTEIITTGVRMLFPGRPVSRLAAR